MASSEEGGVYERLDDHATPANAPDVEIGGEVDVSAEGEGGCVGGA